MDKFEQAMQQMAKMSQQETAKMIESNKKICICPGCPTYNKCAEQHKELLYCALSKSPSCITKEVACICPSCPMTEQIGLTHKFFCSRGTEREQRGM